MFCPSGLIDGLENKHRVVENGFDRRVVGVRQQIVRELNGVLRARNLRRMQTPTNVDKRLSFTRQRSRLVVRQTCRMGEPLCDFFRPLNLR